MNILTIDFETYYAQDFSLTKMTTEEYIRSPRFEVIGVAVQVDNGEPVWFSGSHAETHKFLSGFNWEDSLALAHNAAFDGAILNWIFDIKPKGWLDTLSMARALHGTEVGGSLGVLATHYNLGVKGEQVKQYIGYRRNDFELDELTDYANYCINDVVLTHALFDEMGKGFPPTELRLIDLTVRMFTEPLLQLDKVLLANYLDEVKEKKREALSHYDKDSLMSNNKFAELLMELGVAPPMKTSLATGKQTYAFSKTDEEFKALLEHEDPAVQALVAARLGTKSTLEETRTERFIGIASRGALPVPLRYYAAHTGRWGGDEKLNLQNLKRKSVLKYCIIPPDGHVILDSDSSQIEARTLAWLAKQDDLVEAFDKGEDVYCIMATAIYKQPVTKADAAMRFVGKTTILGCGYGMGAVKFQAQLQNFHVGVELTVAKKIIEVYRETYPKIVELWKSAAQMLDAMIEGKHTTLGTLEVYGKQGIKLPNGLFLRYPNLRRVTNVETKKVELVYDTKKGKSVIETRIYGGKVIENVCQALARIVIGEQMLRVNKKYPVVLTVHDAIAVVVPDNEAERAKEYVEMCMRIRPSWASELPLDCEAGYGKSYGDC